jgi:hypothetical protein
MTSSLEKFVACDIGSTAILGKFAAAVFSFWHS